MTLLYYYFNQRVYVRSLKNVKVHGRNKLKVWDDQFSKTALIKYNNEIALLQNKKNIYIYMKTHFTRNETTPKLITIVYVS